MSEISNTENIQDQEPDSILAVQNSMESPEEDHRDPSELIHFVALDMEPEITMSENSNTENIQDQQPGSSLAVQNSMESLEEDHRDPSELIQYAAPVQQSTPIAAEKKSGSEWLRINGKISENSKSKRMQRHFVKENQLELLQTPKKGTCRGATKKVGQQSGLKNRRKISDITNKSVNKNNKETSTEKQCDTLEKENHTETSEKSQTRTDLKNADNAGEKQYMEFKDTNKYSSISEQVSIRFKWRHLSNEGLITVSSSPHTAIIDALKTSKHFTKLNNKKTHSLVIHGNKMRSYINPLAPCGALKKDEELELLLKSMKKPLETPSYPTFQGGLFIKVNKKGKTLGGQPRIILHNNESSTDGTSFAVFGYKPQTIQEALCNDKRFVMFDFRLQGTKGETFESHTPLSQLPDDTYTVIVLSPYRDASLNDDPQQVAIESSNSPNNDLARLALVPSESKSKTVETLRKQFVNYVKAHGGLKKAWSVMKDNYCNNMKENCLSTHTLKLLAEHADSVGCIVSRHNGDIVPLGTGFLLDGCLGLTCHHVVKHFLHPECPYKLEILFEHHKKGQSIQQIESVFHIEIISHDEDSDSAFFYANTFPYVNCPGGLLKHIALPPVNGHVSLIGHPGGQYQQVDSDCSVINFNDRFDAINETIANDQIFIHILSKYNFVNMDDPRLFTYKTCFYHGSSGSPVFNDRGELVAMHQGGYAVYAPSKTKSVIEYGRTLLEVVIRGALKIDVLRQQFEDIVKKNISLNDYIHFGQHPTSMQPIIRQLLQLWKVPSPQINDSGIGDDSAMDVS